MRGWYNIAFGILGLGCLIAALGISVCGFWTLVVMFWVGWLGWFGVGVY